MEIVIKIPDKMYEDAKSGKDIGESRYITQVIKKGVPLPKAHGDLIDRDKLSPKIHGVKSIVEVLGAEIIIEADKG